MRRASPRRVAVRFALRYWTRRSAPTIAVPCSIQQDDIAARATCLRDWAAQHGWQILGEAFLRIHPNAQEVLHLPVDLAGRTPAPPIRVGRIDHGRVVAAYNVGRDDALQVGAALSALARAQSVVIGPVEYHFDPSVGRTEGIIVVPVAEHPADKPAFVSVAGAVAG